MKENDLIFLFYFQIENVKMWKTKAQNNNKENDEIYMGKASTMYDYSQIKGNLPITATRFRCVPASQ